MGVKETPMDDTEIQEEPATEQIDEVVAEEPKNDSEEQIVEAKPKRKARAKAAPAAKKPSKKKETIDMKQRTICPVCKCGLSMHALLYTHSCTKEALAKRKVQKVFDEPAQASQEFAQDPEEFEEMPPPPPLSYREILAREQMELRRLKQQRIVNPIRAHVFGKNGYS